MIWVKRQGEAYFTLTFLEECPPPNHPQNHCGEPVGWDQPHYELKWEGLARLQGEEQREHGRPAEAPHAVLAALHAGKLGPHRKGKLVQKLELKAGAKQRR